MMNIVAGGMRKYLSHHSELPAESLAAMMPVDIRTEETRHIEGNQVGGIFSELHTEIDDHIERLLAIHDSTNQAKALSTQVNTHAVIQNYMFGFMNPKMGRRANRLMQSSGLMEKFGPFACNTLITNVPGPNFPLYHAGAEMVAYWGIPPLTDCMGLGHAVFSYCGRISLSAIADRTMMEDPGFYIECLNASFDEMYDASQNYEANVVKAAAKNKAKTKRISSAKASSSASAKAGSSTVAATPAPAKNNDTAPPKPERKRAVRKKSASSTTAVSAAPTKADVKAKPAEKAKTEPKAKTDSKVKAKVKAKAKPAKKTAAKPSAKTANKAAVKEDAKVVEKTAGKGAEKAATTASNKVEGSATPTT
jgi:hypothetical protein